MTPDDIADIPDGVLLRLTLEGRMLHQDDERLLIPLDHPYGNLLSKGRSAYATLMMTTAIEVLPEPPPPEPTGRWALVLDKNGHAWVHKVEGGIYRDHWASVGPGGVYSWERLVEYGGPLTVVFEGVDE